MTGKYSPEPCPKCLKERADGTLGENYRCEACRILFFEWKLTEKDKEISRLKADLALERDAHKINVLKLIEVAKELINKETELKKKDDEWIKVKKAWIKFANSNDTDEYYKCGIAFMNFDKLMKDAPKPTCAECRNPESDSKHIRYGPDLDNPVKHEYKPKPSNDKIICQNCGELIDSWTDHCTLSIDKNSNTQTTYYTCIKKPKAVDDKPEKMFLDTEQAKEVYEMMREDDPSEGTFKEWKKNHTDIYRFEREKKVKPTPSDPIDPNFPKCAGCRRASHNAHCGLALTGECKDGSLFELGIKCPECDSKLIGKYDEDSKLIGRFCENCSYTEEDA